jgi:hypothetical protein
MMSLIVAVALMLAVLTASAQWAARTERRRNPGEEGHARDHR